MCSLFLPPTSAWVRAVSLSCLSGQEGIEPKSGDNHKRTKWHAQESQAWEDPGGALRSLPWTWRSDKYRCHRWGRRSKIDLDDVSPPVSRSLTSHPFPHLLFHGDGVSLSALITLYLPGLPSDLEFRWHLTLFQNKTSKEPKYFLRFIYESRRYLGTPYRICLRQRREVRDLAQR